MPRRSSDFENSGDHNWRRLWETPSKKSQRRYARAWVHPLLGDLPISKASAIPKHPAVPSEFIAMTTNTANLTLEDQLLPWRKEMEVRQEEQARQMAELHEQANRLREENERLQTQLEADRVGQWREPPRPFPPSRPSKGKEVSPSNDVDLPADDELSFGSSPLPHRSPSPNAAEAHSRPPRRSSRSISDARRRVRREPNMDQRPPTPAHQYVPDWAGGPPLTSAVHIPALRGRPRSANDCSLRRLGTTEHALHSPWAAYPGLRFSPRFFHTTLCHVRRFFRSVRSHVTLPPGNDP